MPNSGASPLQAKIHEPAVAGNEFWRSRCPISNKLVARFFHTNSRDKLDYSKMPPQVLYAHLYKLNKEYPDWIIAPEFKMRVHTKKGWSSFFTRNLCTRNHEEEIGRCQILTEDPHELFSRFMLNSSFIYYACVLNGISVSDVIDWWNGLPVALKDQAVERIARVESIPGTPWSICYLIFGEPKIATNSFDALAYRCGSDITWDSVYETKEDKNWQGNVSILHVHYSDGSSWKNVCLNNTSSSIAWAGSAYSHRSRAVNFKAPNGQTVRITCGSTRDNLKESWVLDLFRNGLGMPNDFYMLNPKNILCADIEVDIVA